MSSSLESFVCEEKGPYENEQILFCFILIILKYRKPDLIILKSNLLISTHNQASFIILNFNLWLDLNSYSTTESLPQL